mmetsp:Transcript_47534/g.124579  ORF Transcript_47534/g.124579 Transcript_47534/m.124579 type:complete len:245 (-) Transcript_47534:1016-1750(-)
MTCRVTAFSMTIWTTGSNETGIYIARSRRRVTQGSPLPFAPPPLMSPRPPCTLPPYRAVRRRHWGMSCHRRTGSDRHQLRGSAPPNTRQDRRSRGGRRSPCNRARTCHCRRECSQGMSATTNRLASGTAVAAPSSSPTDERSHQQRRPRTRPPGVAPQTPGAPSSHCATRRAQGSASSCSDRRGPLATCSAPRSALPGPPSCFGDRCHPPKDSSSHRPQASLLRRLRCHGARSIPRQKCSRRGP